MVLWDLMQTDEMVYNFGCERRRRGPESVEIEFILKSYRLIDATVLAIDPDLSVDFSSR